MNLTRHAVTLLVALIASTVTPRLYAQVRIAVVDLQRAMNETEDGRAAKRRLEGIFRNRQAQLDRAQEDLKRMKTEIEQQRDVLSREALEGRVEAYQKALIELQSQYVEFQQELAEREAELTKRILDRMQDILRRMGQAQGYTLILERNEGGVVWVPSNLDLTDAVIQQYNTDFPPGTDMEPASMTPAMTPAMSATPSMTTTMTATMTPAMTPAM